MGLFSRKTAPSSKDPVCGMDVDPKSAAGSLEHGGKLYLFCSPSCLAQFKADPARFVR